MPGNIRKIFAISAVILVLLMGGVTLTLIYGGPSIRKWRATQLAEKAEKYFKNKEYTEAQRAGIAAYQLNPDDPDIQRTVGKILINIGHPQAIDLFRSLYKDGHATTEDKITYSKLLLQGGATMEADTIIREALATEPDNIDGHILFSKILLVGGNASGSEAGLRRVLQLDAANAEAQLLLGRMLALSTDSSRRNEGVGMLKKIALNQDKTGLAALKYLLRIPQTDPSQTREWVIAMNNHPLTDEDAKLLAAEWEIRLDPSKANAVYDRLMKEYKKAPSDRIREFCGWLNQRHEYRRTLDILPITTALTRRDYFLLWLDAKAGLGEWADVKKALETPRAPLEGPLVALFRGRAEESLGDTAVADRYFRKAIADALKDPKMLWYFATYFQELGKSQFTQEALRALVKSPTTARAGYQALLAIAAEKKDTDAIASILDEMRQRWPKDISVENDQIYFNILIGKNMKRPKDLEKEIRQLMTADPKSLPIRNTLALFLLKQSRPKEALEVYNDLDIQWSKTNPAIRAVFAAVLEANGYHNEALAFASQIPEGALRQEEKGLINPILHTSPR